MEHQFNTDLAKKYGIEEAIIIHNMYFWISKNAANEKHFYDGRYWTYNSIKAYSEMFPYINETKIFRVLKNLTDIGFLVKGNYNTLKIDRTSWYSFSDDALNEISKCNYGCFKMKYANSQNEITIPDSKLQIVNTDKKEDTNVSKKADIDFDFIKSEWDRVCPMFQSVRLINGKRKALIRTLLKNNKATIEDLIKVFTIMSDSEYCKGNNIYLWKASFDWLIKDTNSCFNRLLEGDFSKTIKNIPDLGFNEWIADGKRYYGSNRARGIEVPLDARPRPSNDYYFDKGKNDWNIS